MNTPIVIPLTEDQMEALDPILRSMEPGGMLVAQIYGDGFRAKALTHAEAKKLVEAMGGDVTAPIQNSAFAAHEAAAARRKMVN